MRGNCLICIILFFIFASDHNCYARNCKFISFNIRYDSGYDGVNCWSNRLPLICDFFRKEEPDIICLQEVLDNQYVSLCDSLMNYNSYGVGRIDGDRAGEYAPIFYRQDKYNLNSKGTFWLSETPDIAGSIGWDAAQPRIVTWAEFVDKKGKSFFVLNTHLDDIGMLSRRKSADFILKKIMSFDNSPLILSGDFNDIEDSPTYKILTGHGSLFDINKIAKKRKGVRYSFHAFGSIEENIRQKVDYIFVRNIKRVKYVDVPREQLIEEAYLSDHNPIVTVFSY